MAEVFETPVGLTSADNSWNFSIGDTGVLELRSNSAEGGGELRASVDPATGQVTLGHTDNPAVVRVVSGLQVVDAADLPRIQLAGDAQAISLLNDSGQTVALLGDPASLRLGGNLAEGSVLLFPDGASDLADVAQASLVLSANTGSLLLGGAGVAGELTVGDDSGAVAIHMDGNNAALYVGMIGNEGDIQVLDGNGAVVMHMDGQNAALYIGAEGNEGDVQVKDGDGRVVMHMDGRNAALYIGAEGNEGDIQVKDGSGRVVMHMDGQNAALYVGASDNEGDLVVRDGGGRDVFQVNGVDAWLRVGVKGNEGDIEVQDASGRRVMHMDGANAVLRIGAAGNEGDLRVIDGSNREVFSFNAESAWLRVGASGNEGDIEVQDSAGRQVMHMNGENAVLRVGAAGNEGDIIVRDDNGNESIHLNGGTGDIILRNADAAEDFTLAWGVDAPPGTVMTLTDDATIMPCTSAYDSRVVGVIAGAGKYRPGIIMDRREKSDERRKPISIMGKVSCRVDARLGTIRVGDMLTTSPTPGLAMKATDPMKAFGSVIGKALSSLDDGIGMVDMLITMR
ncbi:hypothetical protein [Piscinibacter sp.]|uniref:hypothetical protein n=1 Tax=Piscinibacter sp. TaxID=1903157 RepID=UPI002C03552E|nr:hypothetical protein [Albitalea sp.]HUG26471.1 hypothetical protein [Albitalea sp.]